MRILILGYSEIARKRVIPAFASIAEISAIDIASLRSAAQIFLPNGKQGEIFEDYDQAISDSKAELVYISTINSLHAVLAEKALKKGFQVIVDKPAVIDFKDAERLIALAKAQERCLAEATVYAYHPQIALLEGLFASAGKAPTRITAVFSFPPFKDDNFRNKKSLGGGALFDLGPYAVSLGRLFFHEQPKEVYCRVSTGESRDDIDTSFSLLAIYSKGKSLVGHFGFDTQYRNYLSVLGPGISVDLERVFTIPADMENILQIRQGTQQREVKASKGDCFELFFRSVLAAIKNGCCQKYSDELLADAEVQHRLRQAGSTG